MEMMCSLDIYEIFKELDKECDDMRMMHSNQLCVPFFALMVYGRVRDTMNGWLRHPEVVQKGPRRPLIHGLDDVFQDGPLPQY